MQREKVTVRTLGEKRKQGIPITMLTAYDYPMAQLEDKAGIDIVLVGDSVGMTMYGYQTTLPVTMGMMVVHCEAVRRGTPTAFVIGDMPYMSYQISKERAVENAGRLMQEAGVDAVKLEGGRRVARTVEALVDAGIPVMGHLGVTPQSVSQLGGYQAQGRDAQGAKILIEDALCLAESGIFSLLLECIPAKVAKAIRDRLEIPVISLGAGPHCDGVCMIVHDMLGLTTGFLPKFAKRYANLAEVMEKAIQNYQKEVTGRAYPDEEHSYSIPDREWEDLGKLLAESERDTPKVT